jgi:hypothetical protein
MVVGTKRSLHERSIAADQAAYSLTFFSVRQEEVITLMRAPASRSPEGFPWQVMHHHFIN